MTIKFFCTCGQHLRAREEMAGRRSQCPRCGSPVGVPSLEPTQRGAPVAPLAAGERTRGQGWVLISSATEDAPRWTVPLSERRPASRPRRRDELERHWYECLLYPWWAWKHLVWLAVALTALIGGTVLGVPRVLEQSTDPSDLVGHGLLYAVIVTAVAGHTCVVLEGALAAAVNGQVAVTRRGGQVGQLLKSLGRCLVCFLAGPVFLVVADFLYWNNCGDLEPLDWWIVTELAVVAFAYTLYALLAVSESGRLRDANPLRVIAMVERLGIRSSAVVVVTATAILAPGCLILVILDDLHPRNFAAWGLVACAACFGSLFLSTFLFRLLGVWCYRSRPLPAQPLHQA